MKKRKPLSGVNFFRKRIAEKRIEKLERERDIVKLDGETFFSDNPYLRDALLFSQYRKRNLLELEKNTTPVWKIDPKKRYPNDKKMQKAFAKRAAQKKKAYEAYLRRQYNASKKRKAQPKTGTKTEETKKERGRKGEFPQETGYDI